MHGRCITKKKEKKNKIMAYKIKNVYAVYMTVVMMNEAECALICSQVKSNAYERGALD